MATTPSNAPSPALRPTARSAIKSAHIIVIAPFGFQVFSTHLGKLRVKDPITVSANHAFDEVGGRDSWSAPGGEEFAWCAIESERRAKEKVVSNPRRLIG